MKFLDLGEATIQDVLTYLELESYHAFQYLNFNFDYICAEETLETKKTTIAQIKSRCDEFLAVMTRAGFKGTFTGPVIMFMLGPLPNLNKRFINEIRVVKKKCEAFHSIV